MAGGTLLLSVLLLFFDPVLAIAYHGFLQVIANCSRILVFMTAVSWNHVVWFLGLVVPGVLIGGQISDLFNPEMLTLCLAFFILWIAWKPARKEGVELPRSILLPLGFFSGCLGMIIGVTGPLLAPFFLRVGLIKDQFIATKAVCQFVVQLVKVVVFSTVLGIEYAQYGIELLAMSVFLVLGTLFSKRILQQMSAERFKSLVAIVLTLIALRLGWSSGIALIT